MSFADFRADVITEIVVAGFRAGVIMIIALLLLFLIVIIAVKPHNT